MSSLTTRSPAVSAWSLSSMALAATALLAPHFTAGELGVANVEVPADTLRNVRTVAGWLEVVRHVLEDRVVVVVSGYRDPAHNLEVGGSPTSDHPNGLAADWKVVGLSPFAVYQALQKSQEARQLPPFDQLIFYAVDNHIHVGLGPKLRGEILLKTAEGSYVQLAGAYVTKIRGYL